MTAPLDTTELDRAIEIHRFLESGQARALRENAGLTIPLVARTVGISPSMVSRWERNERRPRGEAATRYLDLLRHLERRQVATV